MYEQDPLRLPTARSTASTDGATRLWTVASRDHLLLQSLALMEKAGVTLPSGTLEDLVSVRVPGSRHTRVETEFRPWSDQEVHARIMQGGIANFGEIRLGDNVQAGRVLQEFPGLTENQVRLFQLRAAIHELFHALDFRDVVTLTNGDYDAAFLLQAQHIQIIQQRPGYARNEVLTDSRAGLVLERNGLLFAELRQSLNDYCTFWEGQNPIPEQAFNVILKTLNRTPYP